MLDRYWILTADRVLRSFGDTAETFILEHGSKPVSISSTRSRDGCLVLYEDGHIEAFGTAPLLGDLSYLDLAAPPRDIELSPRGTGYWVIDQLGSIFSFGGAPFLEGVPQVTETPISASLVCSTPDGDGYWIVSTRGEIFCFGSATYHGALGQSEMSEGSEVVSFLPKSDLGGYKLILADGRFYSFEKPPTGPSINRTTLGNLVGAVQMSDGAILISRQGAIFSYEGAANLGSTVLENSPVIAVG